MNTYTASTKATLFNAKAEWSLEIEDDIHMAKYQTMANSLIALSMAKLGEYALGLIDNPNALEEGYEKLTKAMQES